MKTEASRPKKPRGRALEEFGQLWPAEQLLLNVAVRGEVAFVAEGRPTQPNIGNFVRADFVRFLALGGDEGAPVHDKGVRLRGAWIAGKLDLECATTKGGLCLLACHFCDELDLVDAAISGVLVLDGSSVPRIIAQRLRVAGSVFFRQNFLAHDVINIINAKICGNLQCDGQFLGSSGSAIIGEQISIGGGASFANGFFANGEVSLLGGTIRGTLDCSGGVFLNGAGAALTANGIEVGGGVLLRGGFCSVGIVSLLGAQVSGDLDCRGGCFFCARGYSLGLDGATVSGALYMGAGFVALGEVRLVGAAIEGVLEFGCALFFNSAKVALNVNTAGVRGEVYFRDSFVAAGMVTPCLSG